MYPVSSHLITLEHRFDRKPRRKIHLFRGFTRCVRLNLDNNQNAFLRGSTRFLLRSERNFFCSSLPKEHMYCNKQCPQ